MNDKHVFLDKSQNIYGMTEICKIEKAPHSHYMKHIVIALCGSVKCTVNGQCAVGSGFAVQSGATHAFCSQTPVLIISVPDLSPIGKSMNERLLCENDCYEFDEKTVKSVREYWQTDFSSQDLIPQLFARLDIPADKPLEFDLRIEKIINLLKKSEPEDCNMQSLSAAVNLSPGRLSRLFHTQTGVTLKSYLLLLKLSNAFSLILKGENLTTACIDAGFSGSAHFAYALHKWFGFTGTQLKSYLKSADFI